MLSDDFEVIDRRFRPLIFSSVRLRKLYGECAWAEGPAYYAAGRYLIFSDIPNDRMLRWDETTDAVSVFRSPCGYVNGNTYDGMGRLVSCQHQGRAVVRTEHDGSLSILASRHGAGKLNSPNDVVVKRDGTVWFTDPSYGIDTDYEGDKRPSEQAGRFVFRIDSLSDQPVPIANDFSQPNGLAFSPDESRLYIVDSGFSSSEEGPRHIRRFVVHCDNSLSDGRVFATCEQGIFDGLRVDVFGNVWVAAGDGVRCYNSSGDLIGLVRTTEAASNLCFGGIKRNRLFVTATTSVLMVPVNTYGCT